MPRPVLCWILLATLVCCTLPAFAQQQTATNVIVPRLIRFGGVLKDSSGKPLQGVTGITFALYKDEEGGAALWLETQNVSLDSSGHYSVLLGATKEAGVAMDLFTSGAAQWLGVQAQGQSEQPRVWMVSVPYALKAADAETLGGLPPSAFAPAPKPSTTNPISTALLGVTAPGVVTTLAPTGSGTTNFVPLWTSSSSLSNSTASQLSGNIGIGFPAPLPASFASRLDVNGGAFIRGLLQLPPMGSATAAGGKNSNALDLVGSSFLSTLLQPENLRFRWQVEPLGNNTASPSGKLNLLYGLGPITPSETGLSISNGGVLSATGVTLPAAGIASSTHTAGFSSRPLDVLASAWSTSGTPAAVSEHFRWQAEPAGSNTTAPSGTLNLLFASGTAAPAETGLKITSKGRLIFAAGQKFPGTVSSIALSAPAPDFTVSGSPVTASGTLALNWANNLAPTSANTANAIVKRDGSGNFAGGEIDAARIVVESSNGFALGANGVLRGINGDATGSGSIGVDGGATGSGSIGVFGGGDAFGVQGVATLGYGVYGFVPNVVAGGQGIVGENFAAAGVNGFGPDGVDGLSHNAAGSGVAGLHDAGGAAIFGQVTNGGLAGDFFGDVAVHGHLSKSSGSFKIDHPLDPANKYLYHSFVESPDMMNIYNGNVTTDANGLAVVSLPDWFEVLNRDFRYQLTVMGQFAQAIVASEIANHSFTIKTDKPNVKVSWQVTGIRQDAWANAHRIPVEEAKPPRERGYYLHPELFDAPIEKSVVGLRHPSVVSFAKRVSTQAGSRPIQESPDMKKLKVAQANAAKN